jgi:hypothetical protein
MKRRSVAFRLSKQQLAERTTLAAGIREKTKVLNAAIAAFNQAIEPLSWTVIEAQDDYNAILEKARALASGVTEAARDEFDARSERWRGSDKGIKVRIWIERWEVSLDDIDLEVPEPLTEIDPEEHAREIEDAPSAPWNEAVRGTDTAVTGGGAGITARTVCCRCAVSDSPATSRECQAEHAYRDRIDLGQKPPRENTPHGSHFPIWW